MMELEFSLYEKIMWQISEWFDENIPFVIATAIIISYMLIIIFGYFYSFIDPGVCFVMSFAGICFAPIIILVVVNFRDI